MRAPMTAPLLTLFGALLCGCPGQPMKAAGFGEQLFHDARFAESQFNAFSCATCHATTPEPPEGKLFAGYTMWNVVGRTSYWGGQEARLIDAVSFCYVYFMRGPGPLDPEDDRSRALYEYLASLSPDETSEALPFTVVRNVAMIDGGDASRGEAVYRAACRECHGEKGTGAGRLTDLAPELPNVASDYDQLFPGISPRLVFIEKVRHGQFFGIGGNMPLYSIEAMSDAELADLLAYLGL